MTDMWIIMALFVDSFFISKIAMNTNKITFSIEK
ncbi:Uncharacterised protein [Buttiauxella agrestis]|uniref:Uncharacterized protein n=1 Tax=Buttiauxella agrestis TaxID=82977 RepID=A0A381C6V8_9ENTR|nr:Uncharacterised protein [Buttiauxella agrestis]